MKTVMPELRIKDLRVKLPIIQGGMGVLVAWINLVSAVMAEGGIGVLSTVECGVDDPRWSSPKTKKQANADTLKRAIHEVRSRVPDGTLGVNIMFAQDDYEEMVALAVKEGVDIIFSGAGLPMDLPEIAGVDTSTALVPIVSSGRAAKLICRRWSKEYGRLPDAFVVEGPRAGGHLGFKLEEIDDPDFALENLVPAVIAAASPFAEEYGVSIPVIAAGGVFTGADIHKFLSMGAGGVQLGTRFVATDECDAADEFKQAYLDANEDDITIIKSPLGLYGRAIKNEFLHEVDLGNKKPTSCKTRCLKTCDWRESPYCIVDALVHAVRGDLPKDGYAFCGANAWRATEIISVHALMTELVSGYEEAEAKEKSQAMG